MNEAVKAIVQKIIWSNVTIDDVLAGYEQFVKEQADYELELEAIRESQKPKEVKTTKSK